LSAEKDVLSLAMISLPVASWVGRQGEAGARPLLSPTMAKVGERPDSGVRSQ
jgi:hypothetical protein